MRGGKEGRELHVRDEVGKKLENQEACCKTNIIACDRHAVDVGKLNTWAIAEILDERTAATPKLAVPLGSTPTLHYWRSGKKKKSQRPGGGTIGFHTNTALLEEWRPFTPH